MAKPLHDQLPPELLALVEKREAGERRQKDMPSDAVPDNSVSAPRDIATDSDVAAPADDLNRRHRKRRSAD